MRFKTEIKKFTLGAVGLLMAAGHALAQSPPQDALGLDVPLLEDAEVDMRLPNVQLTGELLFQILAADIAAQRGAWAAATNTGLELARVTRDPRLARRAIEYALAGNNLPRAWDGARLWTQLAPQDARARQTELMLAAANGRTENLAQALREQVAQSPNKVDAIIQAQQILMRLNDPARALALLDQILVGEARELPEARAALAQAAEGAGDAPRALREAQAALAARPDWELAAIMVLQFGIDVDEAHALAATRAFIARNPDARDVRLALVQTLAQRGDFDAAMGELQSMQRHTPEDFELLYLQGALSMEANHPEQAIAKLTQYIEVESRRRRVAAFDYDPESRLGEAQFLLARIAEDAGRYDDAFATLGTITDEEGIFNARLRQAVVRGKQGRIDDVNKVLDSITPEDDREATLVALTRAQILREANRADDAIAALVKALEDMPDNTDLRYDLAMLYERQDRVADMEAQLRNVIALDSEHAHALNALGYTLADRNQRLPEAERLIERALQLLPQDPFILDSMGWVQFRLGRLDRAREYLERAWAIRPDAEIGVHLGEVLWVSGQRDRALELWRGVRDKDARNTLLRDTLERLKVRL